MTMKNLPITLFLAFAAFGSASAQDVQVVSVASKPKSEMKVDAAYDMLDKADYECIYKYVINGRNSKGEAYEDECDAMLQFSPRMAKFTDYTAFAVDSAVTAGAAEDLDSRFKRASVSFTGEVYQNSPEGKTTYVDVITPSYVEYAEDFAPFAWEFGSDTLTVCGYPCVNATCSYGGRDWEVWYTEEIPVSFGPWKFAGLPGLIMKASDSEGVHTFTATSFRRGNEDAIVRRREVQTQTTSRDKFIKLKNEFEKDPMNSIAPEGITDITVGKEGALIINGVGLPRRANGYTPIELQ